MTTPKPLIFLQITPDEYTLILEQGRDESGMEAMALDRAATEAKWREGLSKVFQPDRVDRWIILTRSHDLHAEVVDHAPHRLLNADRQPIDDDGRILKYGPVTAYD